MGWAIDTWSIESGTIDEKTFLEDVDQTVASERKILDTVLADKSVDCAVQYFEFPDRVSHIFWRFRDPLHPAYDARLAKIYGDAVEKSYDTMDSIVGQAEEKLSPSDVLLVASDHGFATWRRSVNYDTWLVQNGYLALKGEAQRKNLDELFSHGTFWDSVDWSKTRAYAMGLGEIYINVAGREKDGIVHPGAEYEKSAHRAHRASRDADGREIGSPGGLPGRAPRGSLQAVRPEPHPRPVRPEHGGLPGLLAVLARRPHRRISSRTTPTSGAAITAPSIRSSFAGSSSRPCRCT